MSTHNDEKGKFFTDIISKKAIPVTIQTVSHRIEGVVHVRQGERLKDELNSSEQFMAVTDATIFNLENEKLYKINYLAVQRNNIVWIFPTNEEEDYPSEKQ